MTKDVLKGKRILIVDDEPDVIETLEDLLNTCSLVKAYTFEDARDLLDRESFDMAILDIMGVDGYKLLEIANDKKCPRRHVDRQCVERKPYGEVFQGGCGLLRSKRRDDPYRAVPERYTGCPRKREESAESMARTDGILLRKEVRAGLAER